MLEKKAGTSVKTKPCPSKEGKEGEVVLNWNEGILGGGAGISHTKERKGRKTGIHW